MRAGCARHHGRWPRDDCQHRRRSAVGDCSAPAGRGARTCGAGPRAWCVKNPTPQPCLSFACTLSGSAPSLGVCCEPAPRSSSAWPQVLRYHISNATSMSCAGRAANKETHPRKKSVSLCSWCLAGGRPPQASDLEALQYTAQAVKEVLRLYPAIPIFPREAASADRLPSGHRVDAGEHPEARGPSILEHRMDTGEHLNRARTHGLLGAQ